MINITLNEECFCKYKVELQCKYGKLTNIYVNKLRFGSCPENLFNDLNIFNNILDIINQYDCRDFDEELEKYNNLSKKTLIKFIKKLYSLISKYNVK